MVGKTRTALPSSAAQRTNRPLHHRRTHTQTHLPLILMHKPKPVRIVGLLQVQKVDCHRGQALDEAVEGCLVGLPPVGKEADTEDLKEHRKEVMEVEDIPTRSLRQ